MKKVVCLVVILLFCRSVDAQLIEKARTREKITSKELIGTILPYDLWQTISDGTADVVVLDFWTTGCTSCIASMPKMEALYKRFLERKFKLIMMNASETEGEAKKRLERFERFKGKNIIPAALTHYKNQSFVEKLGDMFPYKSVPHVVWIKDGKVIAISSGIHTTAENIEKALSDGPFFLPEKDDVIGYDEEKDPLVETAHPSLRLDMYSALLKEARALGAGRRASEDSSRYFFTNQTPVWLLKYAYGYAFWDKKGRTVLRFDDKEKDRALEQEKLCYEFTVPPSKKGQRFVFMQNDLNNRFSIKYGIRARIGTMKLETVILKKVWYKDGLASNAQERLYNYDTVKHVYTLVKVPFSVIKSMASGIHPSLPFVDKSGISDEYKIDLTLQWDKDRSFDGLRKELRRHGFDLQIKKRKLEVLIIERAE